MDILAQASSTATSEVLRGLGSPFDEHRCGTTLRDGAKRRRHPKRGSACDDGNTGRAGRTRPCGLFVPNGGPLSCAVVSGTRDAAPSTKAMRLGRPGWPGAPGLVPFLFPGQPNRTLLADRLGQPLRVDAWMGT